MPAPKKTTVKPKENKNAWQRYAELQAALPVVGFDSENPHFRSKYASLAAVLSDSLGLIRDHGFVLVSELTRGEWATSLYDTADGAAADAVCGFQITLPENLSAQALGSWITYARRYGAICVLNLRIAEDDDGNAASGTTPVMETPKASAEMIERVVNLAMETEAFTDFGHFRRWLIKTKKNIDEYTADEAQALIEFFQNNNDCEHWSATLRKALISTSGKDEV